jgi:hypothetical protein
MTIVDEKALATGFYHGLELVADYMMKRVHPLQEGLIKPTDRENCMRGLFLRSVGLINTLKRLNDPLDFQTIVSITRALFELTIDTILVHNDKSPNSAAKIHWWGESAKLKHAEQAIGYYSRNRRAVPDHHQTLVNFVSRSKSLIDSMRSGLWPTSRGTPKHPDRWTNQDLLSDSREADRLERASVTSELLMSLEEFYETEFRRMCWNVHGSGVVTVAGVPEAAFYLTAGLGYKWSTDFGMFISGLLLKDFGFAEHFNQLELEWNEIRKARVTALEKQVTQSA